MSPKTQNHERFSSTCVYKLTSPDYGKGYMGQTGCTTKRYTEHFYKKKKLIPQNLFNR